jgi:hypothetical protein
MVGPQLYAWPGYTCGPGAWSGQVVDMTLSRAAPSDLARGRATPGVVGPGAWSDLASGQLSRRVTTRSTRGVDSSDRESKPMELRVDDPDKGPVDAAVDEAALDSLTGVADSLDSLQVTAFGAPPAYTTSTGVDTGAMPQATMDQAAWAPGRPQLR